MSLRFRLTLVTALLASVTPCVAQNPTTTIYVDANANRHAISPYIYGVAYGSAAALSDLNLTLNRLGGNNMSRYNWRLNADNRGSDWYFESIGDASATSGERGDTFIANSKSANAQAMVTIPILGYVANLGPNRGKLAGFSIARYGAQKSADTQWFPDAGNGVLLKSGKNVTPNNPFDADIASNSLLQQIWVRHLVSTWGTAANGGLKYYIMDNEPSLWHTTHRDVHPTGTKMDEIAAKILDYAGKVKAVDPSALVVGPEEWGWSGYFFSGYDQQYGSQHGWSTLPDRNAHGGQDYLPWLLTQLAQNQAATGKRLLDVFSVHFYPQGGEFWGGTDTATDLLRNRSTRQLWDPNYVSESWINDRVQLIPRLKNWVNTYYPGTMTAITEYNWGAEGDINGATTQADILGIFGREGLDMATRWACPASSSPTYQAFKIFRNYDGGLSTFGDISIADSVPNPDTLSSFAALRSVDGVLTLMVINKALSGNTPINAQIANLSTGSNAQVWQLTSGNAITRLSDLAVANNTLTATVPPQSVTLFVFAPSATPGFVSTATAVPSIVPLGTAVTVNVGVNITQATLANGIIDFEVYDSTGAKVYQQFSAGQNFPLGSTHAYTWTWTPAATGTYTVKLGVFSSDWSKLYHWNNSATTFIVQ